MTFRRDRELAIGCRLNVDFELHFLVGFEAHEIAMIRRQTKRQVETTIGTIHSWLREFMRVSAGL